MSKTKRKKLTETKERKTRKHAHDLELKLAKIINRAAENKTKNYKKHQHLLSMLDITSLGNQIEIDKSNITLLN